MPDEKLPEWIDREIETTEGDKVRIGRPFAYGGRHGHRHVGPESTRPREIITQDRAQETDALLREVFNFSLGLGGDIVSAIVDAGGMAGSSDKTRMLLERCSEWRDKLDRWQGSTPIIIPLEAESGPATDS